MFKGKKLDQMTLDRLAADRRLHATLKEIKEADTRTAPDFVREMLDFLQARKRYFRTMDIHEYLQTGMAVKAAEEVFTASGRR